MNCRFRSYLTHVIKNGLFFDKKTVWSKGLHHVLTYVRHLAW